MKTRAFALLVLGLVGCGRSSLYGHGDAPDVVADHPVVEDPAQPRCPSPRTCSPTSTSPSPWTPSPSTLSPCAPDSATSTTPPAPVATEIKARARAATAAR